MSTSTETKQTDVLIVGTGPVGCTFARCLVQGDRRVLMTDTGTQDSARPGEHLKNALAYQHDIDSFSRIVRGMLHPLSVAPRAGYRTNHDPIWFDQATEWINGAKNPRQDPDKNLDAAAAAYGVGGMFLHWTSATPRHHPTMERIPFISAGEWDELYGLAEKVVNTHRDVYVDSIRHTVVKEALQAVYSNRLQFPYGVQELPVAGERRKDKDEFVHFTGSDTVLAPLIDEPGKFTADQFQILPQHHVTKLVRKGDRIEYAVVEDLKAWRTIHIYAALFIVTAGPILTPQVLWNSDIRPAALGCYLTEHPMTFTQIILSRKIVDVIRSDPRFAVRLSKIETQDSIPIPVHDPPPMVWIPVSDGRPWHCQIHRDSFQYGELPPDIDDRLVVDLRWFSMVDSVPTNRVYFEEDLRNKFGMPQPTFEFTLGDEDHQRRHAMMSDMVEAAQALGGYVRGSEPQYLVPGSSLHIMGTHRMGEMDDGACVTDPYCNVWGVQNLYLGGNGIIPTRTAANPSLTSIALAIRAAARILGKHPSA